MYNNDLIKKAIIDSIINKNSVCFIGSGFSASGKNAQNEPIPSYEGLKSLIIDALPYPRQELEGFELKDLAQIAIDENIESEVAEILVEEFSNTQPTDCHKMIMQKIPWKAIFTTNYDDLIENSIKKDYQVISKVYEDFNINNMKTPIFHLHGYVKDIMESYSLKNIVLHEDSYYENTNKRLLTYMNSVLVNSTYIFFIGYSISDFNIIQSIYKLRDYLKEKSIIIVSEKESPIREKRLQKFGAVYKIGVNGLCRIISNTINEIDHNLYKKREIMSPLKIMQENYNKDDINDMHIRGKVSFNKIFFSLENKKDYIVHIDKEKIENHIKKNIIVAKSKAGNGKSVFLKQLSLFLILYGYEVYWLKEYSNDLFVKIRDIINSKSSSKSVFVIDNAIRYRKIIKEIAPIFTGNAQCKLIFSIRNYEEEIFINELNEIAGHHICVFELDKLDTNDIRKWVIYLDKWGLWGGKAGLNDNEKINYIKGKLNSEIRSILIYIYENSYISKYIDYIISHLLDNGDEQIEKFFIAILINSLIYDYIDWGYISTWLNINENKIKKYLIDSKLIDLSKDEKNWNKISSYHLAKYIMNRYNFNRKMVVDIVSKIIEETAKLSMDVNIEDKLIHKENLKQLMRFAFLNEILDGRDDMILDVYNNIRKCDDIRRLDQFWLQYAMASLRNGDIINAEKYIETSLSIAKNHGPDYDLKQIYDQYCRIAFEKMREEKRVDILKIEEVINILKEELLKKHELIYPLRSSFYIHRFLQEPEIRAGICQMENNLREKLQELIKEMLECAKSKDFVHREKKSIIKDLKSSYLILQNI